MPKLFLLRVAFYAVCVIFKNESPMNYDFCLTRECDACGKVCGGGFRYCPKCNICLCFCCGLLMLKAGYKFPQDAQYAEKNEVIAVF